MQLKKNERGYVEERKWEHRYMHKKEQYQEILPVGEGTMEKKENLQVGQVKRKMSSSILKLCGITLFCTCATSQSGFALYLIILSS